jgi:two-component system, NtrC family, response regulator AtoC
VDSSRNSANSEEVDPRENGPAAPEAEFGSQQWLTLTQIADGAQIIGGMMVRSAEMHKVLRTIGRLRPYKSTVLIEGESGTGKELVARALHSLGPVANGPFVTFNCSNLVESLAESQLFGHVKGAFTDAREDSLGYFRSANGGTLFLDEIGELPLRLQPKLLRAVETHEVQPVGSARSYKVDIRLVAATNRDLRAMVKAGQFRDDLYYRLNAAAIRVAPLRERREAIAAFVGHFIEHYNRLFGKQVRLVAKSALGALTAYSWPGNVRELAHAVESAVLLSDSERIAVADLPEHFRDNSVAQVPEVFAENCERTQSDTPGEAPERRAEWPFLLDAVIKKTLIRSLEQTDGNRRRAANLLGVSRSTLYRMLARYNVGATTDRRHRQFVPTDLQISHEREER